MNYSLIKSINVNNKSLISASSTLIPFQFQQTVFINFDGTKEEFIKKCLVNFFDKEFRSVGMACWRFDYAVQKFIRESKDLAEQIKAVRSGQTAATSLKKKELEDKLIENLYQLYLEADHMRHKCYIEAGKKITKSDDKAYIKSISPYGILTYSFCFDEAKMFPNEAKAYLYSLRAEYNIDGMTIRRI